MQKVSVTATVPADKEAGTPEKTATIVVDYPDYESDPANALEEANQAYGPAAILSNAFANWRITLQSNIRNGLRRNETPEAIAARLSSAKMGVASTGAKIDPIQAYLAAFAAATPERQAEMIEELKTRAATPATA